MATSVDIPFQEEEENNEKFSFKPRDEVVDASNDGVFWNMKDQMTSYVFEQGREKARKAFTTYADIDILRPYFHVEPKDLRFRLIHSLIPSKSDKLFTELYGPVMLVFTLIALLLFRMKIEGHVREGPLMGSAFMVCFGYWFASSSVVFICCYLFSTRITFLQTLTLVGYSWVSVCLILLLSTVFHFHSFFYVLAGIFGSLSTIKMIACVVSRISFTSHRVFISLVISFLHFLFIFYLHFAYHRTVEAYERM